MATHLKPNLYIFTKKNLISSYWPPPKSLHLKISFGQNFASEQNVDLKHSSQVGRIIYGKGKVNLFIKNVLWNSKFKIVNVMDYCHTWTFVQIFV
jgi:hypothetical protein